VARATITELATWHGRVVLAGEHTSPDRYGYVDGAYLSGLRAAGQVVALLGPA